MDIGLSICTPLAYILHWRSSPCLFTRQVQGTADAAGANHERLGETSMRKDLFDELVESVKEMKAIQAGRRKPVRVTSAKVLLRVAATHPEALRPAGASRLKARDGRSVT